MMMGTFGLDNVAVAFALGPLGMDARRTALLGVSFAAAEAGMTLLGAVLGDAWLPRFVALDAAQAGVLTTLAVATVGLAWVKRRPAAFIANPWMLVGLALLLGIDNLIAGASPGTAALPPAQIVGGGALSGALAAAACAVNGLPFRARPQWGAAASALMLAGLALAGIG